MTDLPSYVENKNDYAKFSPLLVSNSKGHPRMRVGVTLELWLLDGWTDEKRNASLTVLQEYCELFEGQVDSYMINDDTQPRIMHNRFIDDFKNALQDCNTKKNFSFVVNNSKERVPLHQVSTVLVASGRRKRKPLSRFRVQFDPAWVAKDPEAFVSLATSWCSTLRPVHGTVGLAPIIWGGMDVDFPELYVPFLKRFPGLDFNNAAFGLLAKTSRHIKAVNWLTVIDNQWVIELGGSDWLAKSFSDQVTLHDFGAGFLIQAGAEPQVGDMNSHIWPQEYIEVNRMLKPIRFEGYEQRGLFAVESPMEELDETMSWIRRFDREDDNAPFF
ncbi:MAG: type VI immunity family protein [Gammaproteobacteria bacterium]